MTESFAFTNLFCLYWFQWKVRLAEALSDLCFAPGQNLMHFSPKLKTHIVGLAQRRESQWLRLEVERGVLIFLWFVSFHRHCRLSSDSFAYFSESVFVLPHLRGLQVLLSESPQSSIRFCLSPTQELFPLKLTLIPGYLTGPPTLLSES